MCYYVEGELYESDLKLNLFQIEGYVASTVIYKDDDNIEVEAPATKVYTKSGYEYDILLSIEEFEKLLK